MTVPIQTTNNLTNWWNNISASDVLTIFDPRPLFSNIDNNILVNAVLSAVLEEGPTYKKFGIYTTAALTIGGLTALAIKGLHALYTHCQKSRNANVTPPASQPSSQASSPVRSAPPTTQDQSPTTDVSATAPQARPSTPLAVLRARSPVPTTFTTQARASSPLPMATGTTDRLTPSRQFTVQWTEPSQETSKHSQRALAAAEVLSDNDDADTATNALAKAAKPSSRPRGN